MRRQGGCRVEQIIEITVIESDCDRVGWQNAQLQGRYEVVHAEDGAVLCEACELLFEVHGIDRKAPGIVNGRRHAVIHQDCWSGLA